MYHSKIGNNSVNYALNMELGHRNIILDKFTGMDSVIKRCNSSKFLFKRNVNIFVLHQSTDDIL